MLVQEALEGNQLASRLEDGWLGKESRDDIEKTPMRGWDCTARRIRVLVESIFTVGDKGKPIGSDDLVLSTKVMPKLAFAT